MEHFESYMWYVCISQATRSFSFFFLVIFSPFISLPFIHTTDTRQDASINRTVLIKLYRSPWTCPSLSPSRFPALFYPLFFLFFFSLYIFILTTEPPCPRHHPRSPTTVAACFKPYWMFLQRGLMIEVQEKRPHLSSFMILTRRLLS